MTDCIFCKIAAGEIPSSKVYEDDRVLVFHDIDKKAPIHMLLIPKKHVESLAALEEEDMDTIAHIFRIVKKLSVEQKLEDGFRVVANTGRDGGQTVSHLHFHLLAGRQLAWPPG